jgi:hypothetical protein
MVDGKAQPSDVDREEVSAAYDPTDPIEGTELFPLC